ncbi:MAG: hypothetical protein WC788_01435 [Candidatus Paceibacterota bacterium]|jgi:hypothetical protein
MQFENKMNRNIPLENEEKKDKGFVEKYLPFLAWALVKKENKMLPVLKKIEQLFNSAGITDAIHLEINGTTISTNKYGRDNMHELISALHKSSKRILTIHFVGRKKVGDVEITSVVHARLLGEETSASMAIDNYGMVQIPKTVKAETFKNDVNELLTEGYLGKCEKTFAEFTDKMASDFKRVFAIDPLVSKPEKTVIVPSKKDMRVSKFYNRRFFNQDSILSPSFYKSSGASPDYSHNGFSDPFQILWWMMIFDYITEPAGGSNANFIDSRGNEISGNDAASLASSADQGSLSAQLSETSPTFEPGKYETFHQSVEASKFDGASLGSGKDDDNKDKSSSSDNTAATAAVAGDGGGGHSTKSHSGDSHGGDSNVIHGTDTNTTGGCTGGCSGGCSGGCGGGGCGGG